LNKIMRKNLKIIVIIMIVFWTVFAYAQQSPQPNDTAINPKKLLKESKIKSEDKDLNITIRNVDITKFPEVNVIVEAYRTDGKPIDTLYAKGISIFENGIEKRIISIQKISLKERVPVDFIFVVDQTGSMQNYINGVMQNIHTFASNLTQKGIDFRLGLVLFSDWIEKTYELTDDVNTFLNWLSIVRANGGGDEKENALEALKIASRIKCRPSANRVVIIVTDAPYHQRGEHGDGITDQTTQSLINMYEGQDIRVFSITPSRLTEYANISQATRGNQYDITTPFSEILDQFSQQMTNLYALKYRTNEPAIPDSINIALLDEEKRVLVRKTIPIVELGRKLIIENLLYESNSSELGDSVKELDVMIQFMTNKPNVSIMIEGHTDNKGSNSINDALSLKRAESVKNYLVENGKIAASRISTKGYGKRRPIADNSTEFGRKLNRRTEIVIMGK
jgi:outer membrane protein OmpA-like peptidoglycan-associated protein